MRTQFHVCMEHGPCWVSTAFDRLMRAQEDKGKGVTNFMRTPRAAGVPSIKNTFSLVRIRFVHSYVQTLVHTPHLIEVQIFFWRGTFTTQICFQSPY